MRIAPYFCSPSAPYFWFSLNQLTMAKPSEIPALLPGLLSCIRMIWNLSKFYNTEERLTGLLRKISNEVLP